MPGARKITVVAVALLLVAGACGGGDKKKDAAKQGDEMGAAPTDGSSTSSSTPGAEGGATATTKPGSAPAGGATSSGGSGSGATATTKPGSTTAATTAAGTPRFAAAGNYVYQRSGKQTSPLGDQTLAGEGSLRVDPPSGDDQHTFLAYGSDTTDQTLRSKSGAIELVHLKTQTPYLPATEFRPAPPVLFAPDPLTVGRTWSWRMTSTDGKVTVDGSFKALRNENIAIGGEQVATTVVEATLTFSGDITGTSKRFVWGSTKYRLVVQTEDTTDLTKPFVVHSESRSTLNSTAPH